VDYEKDVGRNSFNVYRGFVHAHGAQEGSMQLVKRISEFEAALDAKLASLPEKTRVAYQARRTDAMELPGSERWQFPPAIRDEAAWRKRVAGGEP